MTKHLPCSGYSTSVREARSWGKTARTQVYTNQAFNINTTSIEKPNITHTAECKVLGT